MESIFKILTFVVLSALFSCGQTTEPLNLQDKESKTKTTEVQQRRYIYSLFYDKKKNCYQLYRNNEKHAVFRTANGVKPVAVDVFSGDCYILTSGKSGDSLSRSCEILKNGRPAMFFNDGFSASDFCVENNKFYVLGYFADSVITVYKDGSPCLKLPKNSRNPLKISVNGDDVFWAAEKGGKVEIYRRDELLYTFDGECEGFEAADCGIHAMISGKIYCDGKIFMEGGNSYQFLGSNLIASPVCFSLSPKTCYIGVASKLESNGNLLAGVFKYRDPFFTVKPDDKAVGKSDYQTECCGISATGDGVFFVTVNFRKSGIRFNTLHYYYNTEEIFNIEASDSENSLLFVKGY
jgi:hypothetical protein